MMATARHGVEHVSPRVKALIWGAAALASGSVWLLLGLAVKAIVR